mgnify:CR=1 FL=1
MFKSNPARCSIRSYINRLLRYEAALVISLLFVVLSVISYELRLLNSQLVINNVIEKETDYEEFRKLLISEDSIKQIKSEIDYILKSKPEYKGVLYMDSIGYLTLSMMARDFDLINNSPIDKTTFIRGMARLASTRRFRELYLYYKAIFSDAVFFPVAKMEGSDIHYSNSWYNKRTYGGLRKHEGCDIMADNNLRGYYPVISITDGIIEKMGWLELGGYRIGIRSDSGGYFYYAHLYDYAPDLKLGDRVVAGQLLGFMGDSGYGPEGTTGKFDVHLHLGIYVNSDLPDTGEMSVNPYYLLKLLEKNRISMQNNNN